MILSPRTYLELRVFIRERIFTFSPPNGPTPQRTTPKFTASLGTLLVDCLKKYFERVTELASRNFKNFLNFVSLGSFSLGLLTSFIIMFTSRHK